MNCETPRALMAGANHWHARAEQLIRPLLNAGSYAEVIPKLIAEASEFRATYGFPPELRSTYWMIVSDLPKNAECQDNARELRQDIETYQTLLHYSYQVLTANPVLRTALEAEDLSIDSVPTLIWMEWLKDKTKSPTNCAANWLDCRHRDIGLGTLFQTKPWLPADTAPTVRPQASAEIIDLLGPAFQN